MALSQWAKQGRSDSLTEVCLGFAVLGVAFWVFVKPAAVQQPELKLMSVSSSSKVTAMRRAIIGQESDNNFKAVNPHSGALGYGQVMPENVAPWTQEALGRSLTTKQFLADPQIQIKVIDFKLNQYFQEGLEKSGGDEEVAVRWVASTWYSGQGSWWNNTKPQYYNGHPYPSIAEYTASVYQKYLKEKGK